MEFGLQWLAVGQAILVIDDDADFTALLQEVLSARGHRVAVVQDATNVVAEVQAFAPEVVLLDLSLGGIDGLALGSKLKALVSEPFQLVAVTGWSDAQTQEAVAEAGFDGFLPKPLNFEALDKVLNASTSASCGSTP